MLIPSASNSPERLANWSWKRSPAVAALFSLWAEEWGRFQGWDEQLALLRALARSQALFLTLPRAWNTPEREQAYLLYHPWGSGVARG